MLFTKIIIRNNIDKWNRILYFLYSEWILVSMNQEPYLESNWTSILSQACRTCTHRKLSQVEEGEVTNIEHFVVELLVEVGQVVKCGKQEHTIIS